MDNNKSEKIILCYAREDVIDATKLYKTLVKYGFNPWLDKVDLLPGQNWHHEITQTIKSSLFTILLFSRNSVSKRGYVQREFKLALNTLSEIPEDEIFVIPVRLEECEVPHSFKHLHYVDLYEEDGVEKLINFLLEYGDEGFIRKKVSEYNSKHELTQLEAVKFSRILTKKKLMGNFLRAGEFNRKYRYSPGKISEYIFLKQLGLITIEIQEHTNKIGLTPKGWQLFGILNKNE